MASTTAEQAVRNYLTALKNPSSLRDDNEVEDLEKRLESTDDQVERVMLRQRLLEARTPSAERYEDDFVTHAKQWAEEQGVTASAFTAEGVPATVLRRAGFRVSGGRGARRRSTSGSRTRVSSDEVRKALPKGTFTVKAVQEKTGASAAAVRKVIQEAVQAGEATEVGADPDHTGPGRAPTLYRR